MEESTGTNDDDYLQDIARSSYADMLHDDERNHAYYIAIRTVVKFLVTSKEKNPSGEKNFKCCDIGAGSGLLSMMVAKSFLDLEYKRFEIDAYECFKPMSATAKAIIALNGYSDYIKVHNERVGVNETSSNPEYDLLVAELLDTELIGEGCLEVYRFAIQHLCSRDCIFIPQEAKIYIEPICSRGLYNRQFLRDQTIIPDNSFKQEISFDQNKEVKFCPGLMELDDMQVSQLESSFGMIRIAEPKVVFEFKFNKLDSLKLNDKNKVRFKSKRALEQEIVIVMWWSIVMYDGSLFLEYRPSSESGDNESHKYSFSKLSNAPSWSRNGYQQERDKYIERKYGRSIWREHWMQAIYYLPSRESIRSMISKHRGEDDVEFDIYAYHDAFSLWFDMIDHRRASERVAEPPTCKCGVHRRLTRYQIGFLNGSTPFVDLLKSQALSNLWYRDSSERYFDFKACLRVTDKSSDLGANKWLVEIWLKNQTEYDSDIKMNLPDYCLTDDLSWHELLRMRSANEVSQAIESFSVVCNQVAFETLNRIRMRVGTCQGFDVSPLDELIESCAKQVDKSHESHHLWEYSGELLGPDLVIFNSGLQSESSSTSGKVLACQVLELEAPVDKLALEVLRSQWALVFSCNLRLHRTGKTIRTGCLGSDSDSRPYSAKWNHHFKQAVHFLHDHPCLRDDFQGPRRAKLEVSLTVDGMSVKRL